MPPEPAVADRLQLARNRRARSVVLSSFGIAFATIGGGLIITFAAEHANGLVGAMLVTGGTVFSLGGTAMIIPGAVTWAKSQREIDSFLAPTPPPSLASPVVHF